MRWVRRLSLLGVMGLALGFPAVPAAGGEPATWAWPVGHGTVIHGFAPPAEPWLPGHRGVDLAGRAGEAVRAAGAGVVRFAGRIGGVGIVSVAHPDGLLTTYEPVRPLVRRGTPVSRGQILGRLMRGDSHCAPLVCLHWGLRRGSAYLDPLALVGAARVRLLPLQPTPAGDPGSPPIALAAGGLVLVGGLRPAQQLRRRHRSGP